MSDLDGDLLDERESPPEVVDVDHVAGEEVVEESFCDFDVEKRYPAKVLMTTDDLRGAPVLIARSGPKVSKELEDEDGQPPRLFSPDGHHATPSMRNIFRIVSNAVILKAERDMANDRCIEDQGVGKPSTNSDLSQDFEPGSEATTSHIPSLQSNVEEEDEETFQDSSPSCSKDTKACDEDGLNHEDWPLFWHQPVTYEDACDILLGNLNVLPQKICATTPQAFKGVGTFVVDLRRFLNRHDVHLDSLGPWGKPAGRVRYYAIGDDGKPCRVDDGRNKMHANATYEWKIQLKKYELIPTIGNPSGKYVKKIITAVYPAERQEAVALAVVTYEWQGLPFNLDPHMVGRRGRRAEGANLDLPTDGSRNWEMASFNNSAFSTLPSTCSAFFGASPLYAVGAMPFSDVACIILNGTVIEEAKVCTRVPQGYRNAGTFVIDLRDFATDAELRRDGNGVWGKPAGSSRYYKIDSETSDAIRVDRSGKMPQDMEYDVQVLCKRYEHPLVDNRFVRKIYTGRYVTENRGYHQSAQYAVVTYFWKGTPEPFETSERQRRVLAVGNNAVELEMLRRRSGGAEGEARLESAIPAEPLEEEHPSVFPGAPIASSSSTESRMLYHQSLHQHMNVSESQPPLGRERKRKATIGVGIVGAPPSLRPLPRPFDRVSLEADVDELRQMLYRKELENQNRFSSMIERAESFLERFERVGESLLEQMWMATPSDQQVRQEIHVEGEVAAESAGPSSRHFVSAHPDLSFLPNSHHC